MQEQFKDDDMLKKQILEIQDKNKDIKLLEDKRDDKLTVVLEIDEVFCNTFVPDLSEGYMYKPYVQEDDHFEFPEYNTDMFFYARPQYQKALRYLASQTELIIWTRSERIYAQKLIEKLNKDEIFVPKSIPIFYQDECDRVIEDE